MSQENPATPAPAATPGNGEPKVITPPSTPTVPPIGGQQAPEDGKVTLTLKELADLNRDAARYRASVKRGNLNHNAPAPTGNPDVDEAIATANKRAEEAEKRSLQFEVRGGVQTLLEKPEYKNLPASTKDLILKNPGMLSPNSKNLDEALLDIEDWLIDNVIPLNNIAPPAGTQPPGVSTPPATGSGGPTPAINTELEDISKLSGPAKTQAMIRNTVKSKGKK